MVLIHIRFALQHPLQFCKCGSLVVLLQQNTFREFTSAFFTDGSSQLVEQVQHNNTFCIPKYCGHHLASRWLRIELLWPWGNRPYPLSFILWLIVMNPSLICSHQMQKKIIFWPCKMSWNQLVFVFFVFFQVHTVSKLYGVQSTNYNLLCTYNKTYNNLS